MASIDNPSQRKFKLSIASLVIVSVGFIAINFLPGLESVYSTLISAILGILTIYSGGNLGQDYIARKHGPLPHEVPKSEPNPAKDGAVPDHPNDAKKDDLGAAP